MSDASEKVKCPKCGLAGLPGEFCMNGCGRLQGASPNPGGTQSPDCREAEAPQTGEPPRPLNDETYAGSGDECPVELMGRIPTAFVEGCTLALHFRVCVKGELIPDACLKLCRDDEILAKSPRKSLRPGGWTDLPINFRPERAGNVAVRVVLECGRDGRGEAYESDAFPITVYPGDLQEAKSIAVNVRNEYHVNVDRAGDARIDGGSADIASAIRNAGLGETVRQVLERCSSHQEERRYPLHAVRLPSRLTLVDADGFKLHVFSGNCLSFGRSRDNDVVLRVFGEDGLPDANLSRAISKTHFRIRLSGLECQLLDGGPVRDEMGRAIGGGRFVKSTFGTAVSGRMLQPCGAWPLRAGAPQSIEVAPAVPGLPGAVLQLQAIVGRCPEGRRDGCGRRCPLAAATSLLLKRDAAAREAYLVVWKCAELGEAFPALAGCSIVWDGDRFVLESPARETVTARPGVEIGPPDNPVAVVPYQQSFV